MKTKLIYTILGVLVVAGIVAWRMSSAGTGTEARRIPVPLVKVEPPQRLDVMYKLEYTGDVLPIQQANIFSKVNGNLERVYVNIGDAVRTGQVLALIDTTELAQTYQQAQATAENARLTFERNRELASQNLIATQDLDNARTAATVARTNFEAARTRLGYARITAPFSGYITKRFLDPGANVTSNNSTLFTLMDLGSMKVIINVLERDIPQVGLGKKVDVMVDAYPGKHFEGIVTRFAQAVDLSTRTMATEVDIPNPQHLLKPGMFADATIIVDVHKNAITVPTYAMLKDEKGPFVFVADSATAHRRNIKIGIEQNARTEVIVGLDGNERVITTGQQFAKDNAPVKVQ